MSHFDRRLALRLLVLAAVALAAAVAAGCIVGFTVAGAVLSDSSSEDAWAELGAALFGLAAGALAGAIVYTVTTVIGVRRVAPEGRRLATGAALLAAPAVLTFTTGLAGAAGSVGRLVPLGVAGALGFLVVTVVAVLAVAGALDVRRAGRAAGAAVAVAVGCVALAVVLHPAAERQELADVYRRSGAPIALVDGTTLEAPAPGWRLHMVNHPWFSGDATVTWKVGEQYVRLELVAQPTHGCPHARLGWVCERLGARTSGEVIWGERLADRTGGYEQVWVDVAGGRWQLTGANFPQAMDGAEAVRILSRPSVCGPAPSETFRPPFPLTTWRPRCIVRPPQSSLASARWWRRVPSP